MIDPKELRIGNLVIGNKHGTIHSVDGITKFKISVASHFFLPDEFAHIHITPELLERFGFEEKMSEIKYWRLGNTYPIYKDTNTGVWIFTYGNANVKLLYIHQLQNLYHALTGQELTVKELTAI